MAQTPKPPTTGQEIAVLKGRLRVVEEMITEIRRDLARVAVPTADTTTPVDIVLRDPAVWREELATGMRG
jgi:hypothetical protein